MFKKEFADTIKKTIVPLLILPVIPLLFILKVSLKVVLVIPFIQLYPILSAIPDNGYLIAFILFFGIIIFAVGGTIGFAAFQGEYKDKAFEYLFSFPFSRWQILKQKLVPRLMVLLGLCLIFELLSMLYLVPLKSIQGKLFFLFQPNFFPIFLLFFFLVGFLVSLFEQKNWVAVVNLIILWAMISGSLGIKKIFMVVFKGHQLERYVVNGLSLSLAMLVILIPVILAFLSVYRKFDVKSANIHGNRFVIRVLPPVAIFFLAGLFIIF